MTATSSNQILIFDQLELVQRLATRLMRASLECLRLLPHLDPAKLTSTLDYCDLVVEDILTQHSMGQTGLTRSHLS